MWWVTTSNSSATHFSPDNSKLRHHITCFWFRSNSLLMAKQSKGHTDAHTAKQDLDFFCPSGCWSPKVGPGFCLELRRRIAGCGACPAQFHGLRNEKDSFALFLEISLLSSKRGKPSHIVVRFLVIAVASNQHGRSRPNPCLRLFCKWDKIVKIKREKTDTQALRNVLCCRALYRLI